MADKIGEITEPWPTPTLMLNIEKVKLFQK